MQRISQKDLFEFLEDNPLECDVFIGESDVKDSKQYIFVDNPIDTPVVFDNKALYLNTVLISVYTSDFDERNELLKYLQTRFIGSVTKTHEENYYKAVFEVSIIVNEW